jgi:hypothetical protein
MPVSDLAVHSSFLCDASEPFILGSEVEVPSGIKVVLSDRMDEVGKCFFLFFFKFGWYLEVCVQKLGILQLLWMIL